MSFLAFRDFKIDEIVGRQAHLVITADESYVVYVNGRRVGSGGYRQGAAAQLYDVTADLGVGWNRLVVELASSRGAGGLLAALSLETQRPGGEAADSQTVVVTDSGWRILRRWEDALLRGWPFIGGDGPRVWQRQPTGRWRPTPSTGEVTAGEAVEIVPVAASPAQRVRPQWRASRWRELEDPKAELPRRLGPWKLFDWGEEVTGHLTLELGQQPGRAGLLLVGSSEPDLQATPDAVILPIPGKTEWTDPFPRTFRYAFLAGLELRRPPAVRRVRETPGRRVESGVFGISAERREPPAVEEIRRAIREGASFGE